MTEHATSELNSVVAVFDDHKEAEAAVRKADASNIRDSIMVALRRSWFNPKTITVTADGGTVQLTGTVDTWVGRHLAGSTALSAPGATSVENNIRVD